MAASNIAPNETGRAGAIGAHLLVPPPSDMLRGYSNSTIDKKAVRAREIDATVL